MKKVYGLKWNWAFNALLIMIDEILPLLPGSAEIAAIELIDLLLCANTVIMSLNSQKLF